MTHTICSVTLALAFLAPTPLAADRETLRHEL